MMQGLFLTQHAQAMLSPSVIKSKHNTYEDRREQCVHPLAKKLLQIMMQKKTNIALSADVCNKKDLLALIDKAGPYICMVKTHIDIIDDFDQDLIDQLSALAQKHTLIILEDRKFADIGNTVKDQYQHGIYKIAQWADLVTVQMISGPAIIDGLKEGMDGKSRGLLLLAHMSSSDNFITPEYTQKVLMTAQSHRDAVVGFIVREKLSDDSFLYFAPGVQLQTGADNLGQSYLTPSLLMQRGVDVLIVGRGIYHAKDPAIAAQQYRQAGWQAYLDNISK